MGVLALLVVLAVAGGVVVGWRLRFAGGEAADGAGTVRLRRAADRAKPPVILGGMPDDRDPSAQGTAPDRDGTGGAP